MQESAEPATGLSTGDRVAHPDWGLATVLYVEEGRYVTVQFDRWFPVKTKVYGGVLTHA